MSVATSSVTPNPAPWQRTDFAIAALLVAAVVVTFAPALSAGFVNYDDPDYVTNNWDVQAGLFIDGGLNLDTIAWAFEETRRQKHWHPLTWISLALDHSLFGLWPTGYHAVNLALHSANTLFVFAIFRFATGRRWPAALVAALFAVHPLHVEAVAWVSGRKDLLAAFFWLASTLLYLHFARSQRFLLQVWALACFALALLSKSMAVTLPLTLLLWDWWLGRPWRSHLLEKSPYFLLSIATGIATILTAQGGGAMRSLDRVSLFDRFANCVIGYISYLRQAAWPTGLIPYYPLPTESAPLAPVLGATLVLLVITAAALRFRRSEPAILFGWFWYVVVLAPVNGLIPVAAFAWADRYMYLPILGPFTMAAYASARWGGRWLAAAWIAALLALAATSHRQTEVWRDSRSLWTHALAVGPEHFLAHVNLADALKYENEPDAELEHLERAVALRPEIARGHHILGQAYERRGRAEDATREFAEADRLQKR